MKTLVIFGQWCLTARGDLDLSDPFNDPRGLTGSELGTIRIAQCLAELGHDVTLATVKPGVDQFGDVRCFDINGVEWRQDRYDLAIAINEPDLLRGADAEFKVAEMWLNDVSFCQAGIEDVVDLFVSPSRPHMEKFRTDERWRKLGVSTEHPDGVAELPFNEKQWAWIHLGCDPELYGNEERDPRRAVYCSSPDRGLHLLLQEWPKIRAEVPDATLRIFYNVKRWLKSIKAAEYYPPIEEQRTRALYIEDMLRRIDARGGMGVELRDSISHNQLNKELSQAQCLAYPVKTVVWSEGFSISTLEACAAGAVPVILDCDAMGEIYRNVARVCDSVDDWRGEVVKLLRSDGSASTARQSLLRHNRAKFVAATTWKHHCERLLKEIDRCQNTQS